MLKENFIRSYSSHPFFVRVTQFPFLLSSAASSPLTQGPAGNHVSSLPDAPCRALEWATHSCSGYLRAADNGQWALTCGQLLHCQPGTAALHQGWKLMLMQKGSTTEGHLARLETSRVFIQYVGAFIFVFLWTKRRFYILHFSITIYPEPTRGGGLHLKWIKGWLLCEKLPFCDHTFI